MTEDITDRFIRYSKILAIFLLPVLLILFSLVTFERKVTLKGVVLSSQQVTVRSAIKDTLVGEVFVKPGDHIDEGKIAIRFLDTPGMQRQEEISRMSLNGHIKDLVALSNAYSGDLDKPAIRTQLEIQQALVRQEQIRHEDLQGKSSFLFSFTPFKGEIARVYVNAYDKIDVGTPLYEIAQTDSLYVKAMVPEKLFTLIAVGDKVYLKSSIYNYQWYRIFHGEVTFLSQFAEPNPVTGEMEFEIGIRIEDGGGFFRINTTVSCEIVRDRVGIIGYVFQSRNHHK